MALAFLGFGFSALSQAAPPPVCPPELRRATESFPKPSWPALAEGAGAEESFESSSRAVAVFAKALENYADPLWWKSDLKALQACLRKNPDPNSEENLTPALQIEGKGRLRLVTVQAPLVGMYYQYYPLLVLQASPRNVVVPLERRATRCEAPGTVWLETSKGPSGKVAVGSNSCGLNPDCDFETFRVEGDQIRPEPLAIDAGNPRSRFSIPAWIKPSEIGCPSIIQGAAWAKSVKYYEPNTQCSDQENCPEFLRGELKIQAPESRGGR